MSRAVHCVLVAVAVFGLPDVADAQKVADGPPKVQEIQAVERGVFLETDIGMSLMLNSLGNREFRTLGIMTGLYLGYDIAPFLAISLGATAFSAPSSGSPDSLNPLG